MNLLFIISGFERGGAELRLLDFARYFPEDLTFHLCGMSDGGSLLGEFQKYTNSIVSIPISRPYGEPEKLRRLERYIRENKIAVVNTLDLKGLLTAVIIRSIGRSRFRIVHHVVNLLHNYRLHHRLLLSFLLRFVDAVVCNSDEAMRTVERHVGSVEARTIHNGIDTVRFTKDGSGRALRKKLGIGEDEIVVGTVANFRPEKNYPFLLAAFKDLCPTYPKLKLLCAGGGILLDSVRELARECGLSDKAIFPGYAEDVREYFDAMDIFVLCSLKESLPNALIQAMSMELPVMASKVGGCPEVVDHLADGVLFEANNSDEFKKWLVRLLEDRKLTTELRQKGREKIEQVFSLEAMIENYSDFYRNLASIDEDRPNEASLL
jgi:glycosyltransferase involved in cell wall biosynthesis